MRLIDADALIPMMKYATIDNEIGVFPIKIGFDAIQRVIDESPTIDAVEVVRCKDCKYRGIIDYPVCCESTDEWFCAAGERRG